MDIMELTLKMRHLAPTCPDTLRSYPFVEYDPFIIEKFPHVYFCGNQDIYKERVLQNGDKCLKMVSIPRFRETGSIVLMDAESLQTYEIKIDMNNMAQSKMIEQDISLT